MAAPPSPTINGGLTVEEWEMMATNSWASSEDRIAAVRVLAQHHGIPAEEVADRLARRGRP